MHFLISIIISLLVVNDSLSWSRRYHPADEYDTELADNYEDINNLVEEISEHLQDIKDSVSHDRGLNQESVKLTKAKGLTQAEVLRRLRHITTIEDFEKAFNIQINNDAITKRGSLFSNLIQSIPKATGSPPACQPKPDCFQLPHNPSVEQYIPECLNVTRCGGCCSSALKSTQMECVVNETESKPITVLHVDKFRGSFSQKIIQYVDHKTCKCQCKIQAEHCKSNEKYDAHLCRCICDAKDKVCPANMKWDDRLCGCTCTATNTQCVATHMWNANTCKCDCKLRACAVDETFNQAVCQCLKTANQVIQNGN